jgi:RimJ/RimL family protein N-acetyltransferase
VPNAVPAQDPTPYFDSPLRNRFDQPVGPAVPDWTPRAMPPATPMVGRYCRVEPVDVARHGAELFDANMDDADGKNWTYLFNDFPADGAGYLAWLTAHAAKPDPMPHAIIDLATGRAVGLASFMRIDTVNGVIEVGHINYTPRLQRRRAATEAMYLMMKRVFDELGYRRYEWKCDALNAPSRAAARRYGFRFEGVFRKAVMYKGRARDTAWFSITDTEWPAVREAFERWLAADNFDAAGQQRRSLAAVQE